MTMIMMHDLQTEFDASDMQSRKHVDVEGPQLIVHMARNQFRSRISYGNATSHLLHAQRQFQRSDETEIR